MSKLVQVATEEQLIKMGALTSSVVVPEKFEYWILVKVIGVGVLVDFRKNTLI